MPDDRSRLDPALAGELIGASIVVERAPGVVPLPLRGTIVDETLNTFLIRRDGTVRTSRIAKHGLEGVLLLGERTLTLSGDSVRLRPEDRTKRLLASGRRRFR